MTAVAHDWAVRRRAADHLWDSREALAQPVMVYGCRCASSPAEMLPGTPLPHDRVPRVRSSLRGARARLLAAKLLNGVRWQGIIVRGRDAQDVLDCSAVRALVSITRYELAREKSLQLTNSVS